MRNIIIVNSAGDIFNTNYDKKIDIKSREFKKSFFNVSGSIMCVPLLDTLKSYYEYKCPNSIYLKELLEFNDKYNIHLIYNSMVEYGHSWNSNKFIETLFGIEMLAENICVLCASSELSGINIIDDLEYENFVNTARSIISLATQISNAEYLSSAVIMINDDNCLLLEDEDIIKFQDNYLGTKKNSEFIKSNMLNDDECVAEKPGLLLYQCGNDAQIYFKPIQKNKLDIDLQIEEKLS